MSTPTKYKEVSSTSADPYQPYATQGIGKGGKKSIVPEASAYGFILGATSVFLFYVVKKFRPNAK